MIFHLSVRTPHDLRFTMAMGNEPWAMAINLKSSSEHCIKVKRKTTKYQTNKEVTRFSSCLHIQIYARKAAIHDARRLECICGMWIQVLATSHAVFSLMCISFKRNIIYYLFNTRVV